MHTYLATTKRLQKCYCVQSHTQHKILTYFVNLFNRCNCMQISVFNFTLKELILFPDRLR